MNGNELLINSLKKMYKSDKLQKSSLSLMCSKKQITEEEYKTIIAEDDSEE